VQPGKRRSAYHTHRVTPLCYQVVEWIHAYIGWMRGAAYRLRSTDPAAARAILDRLEPWSRLPLFFSLHLNKTTGRVELHALTKKRFHEYLIAAGFLENCSRKYWDRAFRTAGIDSVAISALMGRAHHGQEPHGTGSALVPIELMSPLRKVQAAAFEELSLPTAHIPSGRAIPSLGSFLDESEFQPIAATATPSDRVTKRRYYEEPCPFHDATGYLYGLYTEFLRALERTPPTDDVSLLTTLLVLVDGVTSRDELTAVLAAVRSEEPWRFGAQWFLDVNCRLLGVRRVWLSPETALVLNRLRAADAPLCIETADRECARWLKKIDLLSFR